MERDPRPADVLVIFGITGDLAKVMTFRSLYRLEARNLLDCPIIGVAVNDWTRDDLATHARDAIETAGEKIDDQVFDRFLARLSYVAGDFGAASTYQRVADAIGDARTPVYYLEIPPFLFGRVAQGLGDAGLIRDASDVDSPDWQTSSEFFGHGDAIPWQPHLRPKGRYADRLR